MEEQFLSDKLELKFAVEAMTQCGANCIGCFLTPELKNAQNFWGIEKFNTTKKYIQQAIKNLESQGKKITEIALNMGQGDYMQLSEAEIKMVVDFIYEAADGKSSAFITTSGVANHEKFKTSTDLFYKFATEKNQALLIDLVLDASRLSSPKMLQIYAQNISYIRAKFGHVDINLNINADTVENFSPEIIDNFMKQNELGFLAVNVIPANHNKIPLQQSWNKIVDWLMSLYDIWDNKSYKLNYADRIKMLEQACQQENTLIDTVKTGIYDLLLNSFVIDNNGDVFFQLAGFGDLPLTSRNGFKSIGSIYQDYNPQELSANAKGLCLNIIKEQIKQPCTSCNYQTLCATNGMFSAKKILNEDGSLYYAPNDSKCPINLTGLYDKIFSEDNKSKNMISHCFGDAGIFVQKGFNNPEIKTMKLEYSDKEITIPILKK